MLIRILVVGLGRVKVSFGRVQVSQRKVRREILGVGVHCTSEKGLGKLCIPLVTRQIAEGGQRGSITSIQLQNF